MGIKTALCLVLAAGSTCAAHPLDISKAKNSVPADVVTTPVATPEAPNFFDNFDSYASGSMIAGQGGWTIWYTGGSDATVSSSPNCSAPNSLCTAPGADIVQLFSVVGGKWAGGADVYVPTAAAGDLYFISMNQYIAPLDHWSVQVRFGGTDNLVESQFDFNTTSLIRDGWVPFGFTVDLDIATGANMDISYNGSVFAAGLNFQSNVSGVGGASAIANYDLYNASMSPAGYWDNVYLKAPCYADCEGDGDLDVFDFLCFQGQFATQAPYADCEGDGDWDVFDFLCFQGAFAGGC